MSSVFTYCSTLYLNIAFEDDDMISFSRVWMSLYRQLGFPFLIPVSNNLTAEKCTDTFDIRVAAIIIYSYYIVFDRKTHFMSDYFKD